MDQTIINMLKRYQCITDNDYDNALKQIIQQVVLLALWRAKFFEHAAFYGGTALRILYQLDRFSEDLDFSLLEKKETFSLTSYLKAIEQELEAFGFSTKISLKDKTIDSAIQSAFLKANTREHLLRVEAPAAIQKRYPKQAVMKVKIEIDTDPPLGFRTETKYLLEPIPFWVRSYTLPDLFAGKISAVLCRQWQTRVKGRDWYDFIWFIQNDVPVHLSHLEQRLRCFNYYKEKKPLTKNLLLNLLYNKITNLDVKLAKQDIIKFIRDSSRLDAWSQKLFLEATNRISVI